MTAHGADVLRSRIAGLNRRLQELLHAREESGSRYVALLLETDETFKKDEARARSEHEARLRELAAGVEGIGPRVEERHRRDLERIGKAFSNASARTGQRTTIESAQLDAEKRTAAAKAVSDLRKSCAPVLVETSGGLAEIAGIGEEARRLKEAIAALAATLRIRLWAEPPSRESLERIDPGEVAAAARKGLGETWEQLDVRKRSGWVRFARSSPRFLLLAGLVVLAHGAALLAVRQLEPDRFTDALWIAPLTFLGLLSLVSFFCHWVKQKAHAVVDPLHDRVVAIQALLQIREEALRGRERGIKKGFLQRKSDLVSGVEEKYRSLEGQAKNIAKTRMEILEEQRDALAEKALQRKERLRAREEARLEAGKKALEEGRREGIARRQQAHAARKKEIAERERVETEDLAVKWKEAVLEFRRAAEEACRESRERHPRWSDPRWQGMVMPGEFPDGVYLGDVKFDLETLVAQVETGPPFSLRGQEAVTLPLDLSYPGRGSLFMGMDSETRGRSLQGLFGTVLRVLCSFPPGKAKFVLFDPVGLGQNFSALMHLADYDESLVGGRIWTETVHIERKLAELTEHIEKVIQKYLRNRYGSIGEYNREVAQMAEAYRFLVIADFPTGFSELALERLASIVTSGPRCGVHTLVLRDRKQKVSSTLDPTILKEAGLVLQATAEGSMVEEEVLDRGVLAFEAPPAPEALTSLLHSVGKQCAAAGRVELSFELVAPKEGKAWSETTEGGIRIPLGRAGADRLQYLDLGRGTAQHALVAGKTGSGKSTLFHVMVTNSSLWYSPRELEVYLIDFKKGVEFKTYATHRLPHARVVAIESDREFGLSVLRRVDAELVSRAELFRKAGVQDFAGFRKAGGAERLPRTLLMIDEFQEFFVEEDAVAQEAALLMDRIVRQGRAFGVHVVLGSQTLGGSYTLAKTTLGQMAVRIALQCNEADSYLILNDENAAARLLSRPGEAIYNDMSGMVEGNNPFQIAWLPDEVRDRFLRGVSEKAGREGVSAREPMTVFEGNVPAEIGNNVLLKERLARPFQAGCEDGLAAWIGEANAIKGPTEVRFKNQGSSNLVIVGQHRESALSVISSAVVSLAAACPPAGIRFVVFDGSPPELGHGRHFSELAKTIPHEVSLVEYRQVAEVVGNLDAEVSGRMEGKRPAGQRVILVVYDVQRFRQLRQKSEFDFGGGQEEKASPDRCFANILAEGPPQGIHSILWADSLNNLNRTLSRKTLKEFQMRILFQMSGTDSAELIDSPMASTLGLYRGLLFMDEQGTVEKFRPYAVPDAETLEEVRKRLRVGAP